MSVKIEESWKQVLVEEFNKPYFKNLVEFVKKESAEYKVYPPGKLIFSAFDHCPFESTRVVIIGQDPYHGVGQANGLSFSVPDGVGTPPSLRNIFKEIKEDLFISIPTSGNLERWASQGVLLLNATLTVRAETPGSHQNKGWEQFTDAVIQALSAQRKNLVFILWGAYAHKKGSIIDASRHLILSGAHPSPFAAHRGFFGCAHFSKTNLYLQKNNLPPINW